MSEKGIEARYASFLDKHPEYETTSSVDELRRSDFGRLDDHGHVYLDYTGGGLYAESQVRSHMDFLLGQVLGNPHSASPASAEATHRVEECRSRILDFFEGRRTNTPSSSRQTPRMRSSSSGKPIRSKRGRSLRSRSITTTR